MEEKILLQSKHYNVKKLLVITTILTVLVSVIILLFSYFGSYYWYKVDYDLRTQYFQEKEKSMNGYSSSLYYDLYYDSRPCRCEINNLQDFTTRHPNAVSYAKCLDGSDALLTEDDIIISLMPLTLIILIVLLYFWLRSYSLTVTDKRVYGQTAFGKRVDLPIDSVSAVGTSALKGISVGTSSGKISFKLIKNQVEMHSVISNLLKERQEKEKSQTVTKETTVNQTIIEQTSADELKKFKELLDMGAITQDEFDAKKKELLGL